MSLSLPKSLGAWAQPVFSEIFCQEVAALPYGTLPLQHAMSKGSHVVERPPTVVMLSFEREDPGLAVRAGVFFQSVIAGCNCADDPGPDEEITEYCELTFLIDAASAETRVGLD